MNFDMDAARLDEIATAMDEGITYGINANTAAFDERAWEFWEAVCGIHHTSPLRTSEEARTRPERCAHLLAALMLYASAVCTPRTPGRCAIKPSSALAYPLAIIRIFGRWGVQMPSYKLMRAALNYLSRLYVNYHGPHSLTPKRAEPFKYQMLLKVVAVRDVQIGQLWWGDSTHDVFMVVRLFCFLWPTAFRLAAICAHTSGEIMCLTMACVSWSIRGHSISRPTRAELMGMRDGVDYARILPPREKADQWGEIHCPHPINLVYHDAAADGAAALRDLELRLLDAEAGGVQLPERDQIPLFHDEQRRPYSHARLARLLLAVLTFCYGKAVASLYTFHSFRSGLATALWAAGVEPAKIMLMCRWMCADSLHVYARQGVSEHEGLRQRAKRAVVDTIQAVNVPSVVGDQRYAELVEWQCAQSQRDYSDALEQAPTNRAVVQQSEERCQAKRPRLQLETQPASGEPVELTPAEDAVVGDTVVVRRPAWPGYPCTENGGAGWGATVRSATGVTVVVRFDKARLSDGRAYEDMRVPRMHIARRA
jgi:hypothetical protein